MKGIVIKILPLLCLTTILSCSEPSNAPTPEELPHYLRKDNFTVLRVLITNAENQILMTNDSGFWGMPWVNFTKRQFVKEAIDSMAMEHGIELSDIELRGQFCFNEFRKKSHTITKGLVCG